MHIPDGASPLHTMQLQPIGKLVLAQNKTLHNETKLVCFTGFHTLVVCRHLRKWLQLFIFKGENNLLRRHALYRSSSMHPKYRIPSVAIHVHQLCSSTYHLRKSLLQMKMYFTSFYSHSVEKPFLRLVSTNQSNRHDTSSTSRD